MARPVPTAEGATTAQPAGAAAASWARAHAHGLALAAVVLSGLLLRLYQIGAESYWFDEIYTLYDAARGVNAGIRRAGASLSSTGYLILAGMWMRAFGTSEAATRTLSALCGVGCVAVVYEVGREWLDRRAGLIAAALLAFSEFQIYYAQDFRFYAPLLLLTLLSFLFFVRLIERGGAWNHLLYALSTLLALYTHAHTLFSVLAQGLYLLVRWRALGGATRRRLVMALAVVAAGAMPMVVAAAQSAFSAGSAGALGWIEEPTLTLVARTLYWYVLPLRHERSWTVMALTAAAAGGVLAVGVGLRIRRVGMRPWLGRLKELGDAPAALGRRWHEVSLLTLWGLCPIVAPFVLSKVVGPMYTERYTIAASPAWYLLMALALRRVRRIVPLGVALAALAVLILPGLAHYYAVDVKEQWREVAAHLEAEGRPGDVVILLPDDEGWLGRVLGWYYQGALPRCSLTADLEGAELVDAFRSCAAGRRRSWLIMRGPAWQLAGFREALLDAERSGLHLEPQGPFVRVSVYLSEGPAGEGGRP